nr:PREDICTED: uncharacterized protein LOC102696424 [Lepisosteus oculatus]
MNSSKFEMPVLGRPFQLGMLYDSYKDAPIQGTYFWDKDSLEKNSQMQPLNTTEYNVIESDSIQGKVSALTLGSQLKASLLSGLTETRGAANYFHDRRKSQKQTRFTLQYRATSRLLQLPLHELVAGAVSHPSDIEKHTATHVVTALQYGAEAYFVFDLDTSENENERDTMHSLLTKIPYLSMEQDALTKLTPDEEAIASKCSCTLFGDFCCPRKLLGFQDVIDTFRNLPKALGPSGEHALPVKAWLCPLSELEPKAARLVQNIPVDFIEQYQDVLEEFNTIEMRSDDLIKDPVARRFPEMQKKAEQLKCVCHQYKSAFQEKTAKLLIAFRGGKQDDAALMDLLKMNENSPFYVKMISKWLDHKERETSLVRSFLSKFKGIKVLSSMKQLDDAVLDPDVDSVVCFTFTHLHQPEPYLSDLHEYLSSDAHKNGPSTTEDLHRYKPREPKQWICSNSMQQMRVLARYFLELASINANSKTTRFFVASKYIKDMPAAAILLYEDGLLESTYLDPLPTPDAPEIGEITHSTVILKARTPENSQIVNIGIEFRANSSDCWTQPQFPEGDGEVIISDLLPYYEYQFRSIIEGKLGYVVRSQTIINATTLPTSPPSSLKVLKLTTTTITLSWENPSVIGEGVNLRGYKIEYKLEQKGNNRDNPEEWTEKLTGKEEYQYTLKGLNPNTTYLLRVSCDCGDYAKSAASDTVSVTTLIKKIAQDIIEKNPQNIIHNGTPCIYKLTLKKEVIDQYGFCRRFTFGRRSAHPKNKTIMVLGATGSGKTTLINGMINYILGVDWEDHFRFKLILEESQRTQAESQTSEITAYEIHYQRGFSVPYSLTIVDTPGFGDTRGIEQDRQLIERIRDFFCNPNGATHIDVVCFVVQAALARLTAVQKYVFDSILSIFGKDIHENIQLLVTFADAQTPPVLEAINASEVPCAKSSSGMPVHFKFNNSALFACNKGMNETDDQSAENFDKMFWKMGINSMKMFFEDLERMETRSLQLTKEVLEERKQLEVTVEGLQPMIKAGLHKLEEIRQTQQALQQHQNCIDANKDFEYEVEVTVPFKQDISGSFITNCNRCHFTCHFPCMIADDAKKSSCSAMDKTTGTCKVCPGKCEWQVHFNQKYQWEYKTKREKRMYSTLKKEYEKAVGEKMNAEKIHEKLEEELQAVDLQILDLIKTLNQGLARLSEIALRPNPLATPDYIDLLIAAEREEAKAGFKERIKSLMTVRESAVLLHKVSTGQDVRPEEMRAYEKGKARKNVKGIFTNVKSWLKFMK